MIFNFVTLVKLLSVVLYTPNKVLVFPPVMKQWSIVGQDIPNINYSGTSVNGNSYILTHADSSQLTAVKASKVKIIVFIL